MTPVEPSNTEIACRCIFQFEDFPQKKKKTSRSTNFFFEDLTNIFFNIPDPIQEHSLWGAVYKGCIGSWSSPEAQTCCYP